jgi:hypothetical protein
METISTAEDCTRAALPAMLGGLNAGVTPTWKAIIAALPKIASESLKR